MQVYSYLVKQGKKGKPVLATIIKTGGSTPQVTGASALITETGLLYGTIGGGILEGEVIKQASLASITGKSALLKFDMDADIADEEGAICGGMATVLLDAQPLVHEPVLIRLIDSLSKNNCGLLITCIETSNDKEIAIERYWLEKGDDIPKEINEKLGTKNIWSVLETRERLLIDDNKSDPAKTYYIEPVFPVKKLLIIGGGHVGKALCHIAGLIDFEITVIDDRPEFADKQHLPDAFTVISGNIDNAFDQVSIDKNTFIVIVTQGHLNDATALKQCLHSGAAYIGMIGSRRKTRLIKDKFIKNNWATKEELDKIYAPIGLDIGSESVQEIAISIAAELIEVSKMKSKKKRGVSIVILAAGESKRMGEQKMLLPYEDKTIIETVVDKALHSKADHVLVVTGSHGPEIRTKLSQFAIDVVINDDYKSGMLSSVQTGIRSVPEHAQAMMLLLGDQPMVKTEIINQIIAAYNSNAKRIVLPVYKGKRGHPVLIDISFKPDVKKLNPQKGLRQLIIENPEDILEVEVNTSSILKDIDTKEDYERQKLEE